MKAGLDLKILKVLKKNPQGLSTLAVSTRCGINRRTATKHLGALAQKGDVIKQTIHPKMFLFFLSPGCTTQMECDRIETH